MAKPWQNLLPNLDHRAWILAAGRLLSQLGIGFTLFYAPIFFTEQVGLSATAVGLGLGAQSITGIAGRFLGGSMADSPRWGRRKTLLLSAVISAVADVFFVVSTGFSSFLLGNLLMGAGVGLYWPATEATVADLTPADQRSEAFAVVRLADSLGVSLGVVLGGAVIAATGRYRLLFAVDGVTFLVFLAIVAAAIPETRPAKTERNSFWQGWGVALGDRRLLIYAAVNVLFTTYLAQIQSTLPVYLHRFAEGRSAGGGLAEATLSGLFTWHVALTALLQLPVARGIKGWPEARSLMLSLVLWAAGFLGVWLVGTAAGNDLVWATAALGVLAVATVTYMPVASTLVVNLAQADLRGVYLSVNSMCWALGYLIGPPLGGWALDQSTGIAHGFWVGLALGCLPGLGILVVLGQRMRQESLR